MVALRTGGPPQGVRGIALMARRDIFPSRIAHPQFARAARTPNAKAPALWTHQQCGFGFCGFQYSGRSNQQTFLDQQVREEYRRFHRKNSTAPCGRITMLGGLGMTHLFQSGRWMGYAALICAVLMFLVSRFSPGLDPLHGLVVITLLVFGLYCGVRGLFVGAWLSRICAGLSMLYWGWMFLVFLTALSKIRG